MTYKVTLDFTRGPSLSMSVQAANKEDAIQQVKRDAQGWGFDYPVKKAVARPV